MAARSSSGRDGWRAGKGDPPWLAWVNHAEITAAEAMAYLDMGDPARAETLFQVALGGVLGPRNRALYTAHLAASILAQGHLDDAVTVGTVVLDAIEAIGIASARVHDALRPISQAAKTHDRTTDSGTAQGREYAFRDCQIRLGEGEPACVQVLATTRADGTTVLLWPVPRLGGLVTIAPPPPGDHQEEPRQARPGAGPLRQTRQAGPPAHDPPDGTPLPAR